MAAMEGFKNFLPPTAVVVRDGKEDEIEAKFLVPGDLVNVKNGNKVPADIIVLTASNFQVDTLVFACKCYVFFAAGSYQNTFHVLTSFRNKNRSTTPP